MIRYLSDAIELPRFKAVASSKLTLQQNKKSKREVVPFCAWVTQLLREFITWKHFALLTTAPQALRITLIEADVMVKDQAGTERLNRVAKDEVSPEQLPLFQQILVARPQHS
jgi:hypothetical protein